MAPPPPSVGGGGPPPPPPPHTHTHTRFIQCGMYSKTLRTITTRLSI